jgi:CRISPR-associated endonuclease/helicase Cas3
MTHFSHSKTGDDLKINGSKSMASHTMGVVENAVSLISPVLGFRIKNHEITSMIEIIGKLHDLGKYTSFFQDYLLQSGQVDSDKKRHPPLGAMAAYSYFKDKDEKQALIALFTVFLHHGNLVNIEDFTEKIDSHLWRILAHQKEDLSPKVITIEKEIGIGNLNRLLEDVEPGMIEKSIRRGFKLWVKKNNDIEDYFLVNYLFSLLIEGDKLDASDTKIYKLKPINSSSVDNRFGKPNCLSQDLSILTNSELRNYCRAEVISRLKEEDILDHGIFTLTAPTGIGKTMTALDFSLKIKEKIKTQLGLEARIIYALPFINIIEQALKEYKETLSDEIDVLAHYQYADIFGEDKKRTNQYEDEIKDYNQKVMALDTWQADVVITSFVQFFETLIGNRNRMLKKFNHYANAIIILDEVQTLRLDHMPLIGASLFYLSKLLKSRIILMTATKPKIFELAQTEILDKENEKVMPYELLKSYEKVFGVFKRTKIVPLLNIPISEADDFTLEIFDKKWSRNQSCIIVCNTVKRSIELYDSILTYLNANNFENPIEYLSTNIIPAVRFDRISKIKSLLNDGKAPILISTQVVEAGVDLDFDMGFRDLGPIDSIIQVAGRINRNNDPKKEFSPLFIVDFLDSQKIYKSLSTIQAKKALSLKNEFLEPEYLKLIEAYFDGISEKKSFDQFNKIFNSMKSLRYDSEIDQSSVSDFKIIEESTSTQSVFVELGREEIKLREMYLSKIRNQITKENFDKNYKQKFQQRIIAVPNSLTKDLPFINEFDDRIKIVPIELIDEYYNCETGFKRSATDIVKMF